MHSWTSRANAIFAFSTFILIGLTMFNYFSTYYLSRTPENAEIKFSVKQFYQSPLRTYYEKQIDQKFDYADAVLEIKADLTSAFNWNTKQLFVFVIAEYKTEDNKKNNQVVLWDKIITSQDKADIFFNVKSKYAFIDQGLKGNNVTISLMYDVTPITGVLYFVKAAELSYSFPTDYSFI
eukprot:TRINITY_DN5256_c0_g1_i1.p1 TRINITY_DN5256_c0_g1~~TRINITY_DN5256_c0_g1_i1.p1  ORF type:complete len:179 (-),score=54.09 TRINITY_DN5256_c0_g1_i1:50-586(-)